MKNETMKEMNKMEMKTTTGGIRFVQMKNEENPTNKCSCGEIWCWCECPGGQCRCDGFKVKNRSKGFSLRHGH